MTPGLHGHWPLSRHKLLYEYSTLHSHLLHPSPDRQTDRHTHTHTVIYHLPSLLSAITSGWAGSFVIIRASRLVTSRMSLAPTSFLFHFSLFSDALPRAQRRTEMQKNVYNNQKKYLSECETGNSSGHLRPNCLK